MSGSTIELRLILAMAPSFQGGHSKIGGEVAAYLDVPFPLRVPDLKKKAKAHGFDPYDIWPWLKQIKERPVTDDVTQFARFAPQLRHLGFKKQWDSRSGGARVAQWSREEPDGRTLLCQIWDDGRHRINHEWVGCSDTAPTDFTTEGGLAAAIQREATRTDGTYRDPNNHHVPAARRFLLDRQGREN